MPISGLRMTAVHGVSLFFSLNSPKSFVLDQDFLVLPAPSARDVVPVQNIWFGVPPRDSSDLIPSMLVWGRRLSRKSPPRFSNLAYLFLQPSLRRSQKVTLIFLPPCPFLRRRFLVAPPSFRFSLLYHIWSVMNPVPFRWDESFCHSYPHMSFIA